MKKLKISVSHEVPGYEKVSFDAVKAVKLGKSAFIDRNKSLWFGGNEAELAKVYDKCVTAKKAYDEKVAAEEAKAKAEAAKAEEAAKPEEKVEKKK